MNYKTLINTYNAKYSFESYKSVNKNIFILWYQGFDNAPFIVKKCLKSWKDKNPGWNIIELHQNNLANWIDINHNFPKIDLNSMHLQAYSDIIRIHILEKHGGCWCDATLFCAEPLDNWLHKYTSSGFFAFTNPGGKYDTNRMLSSWFLYGEKDNYIIKAWKNETVKFWNEANIIKNFRNVNYYKYFWFHMLFTNLYNTDVNFRGIWDSTIKYEAFGPYKQFNVDIGLNAKVTDYITNIFKTNRQPVYKLNWKTANDHTDDSVTAYILNNLH
jgi:hypothetical protein